MKELMESIIIIKAREPLITYEKSETGCQSQKKNLKGADQTIIKPVAIKKSLFTKALSKT